MLVKFLGEFLVAKVFYNVHYPISAFLMPSYIVKSDLFHKVGQYTSVDPFFAFFILWTLPFMWIGVSMSVRRAYDAGLNPRFGMFFLIPFLNYLTMFCLAIKSSNPITELNQRTHIPLQEEYERWKAALSAIAASIVLAFPVIYFSTIAQSAYGTTLFVGLPTIMGAVATWIWNRRQRRSLKSSIGISCFAVSMAALVLLLFAAEGFICVLMVLPFALIGGILGGLIGDFLSRSSKPYNVGLQCCTLSALLALSVSLEDRWNPPGLTSVTTSIEVSADPMTVFKNVVEFSELPPPSELIFKAGVAYPVRARIEGSGVGALRHCEFSTGAFVEPITAWEPGKLLAFSVISQPPTMEELSFYGKVSPRHLTETFKSLRGEFHLTELGPNRTLLQGTTWYQLDMDPFPYWAFLTNQLVHMIHGRVLEHVKSLSER